MAVGTTSTTPSALKQYWHDFFIEFLVDNLAMKGLTQRAVVPKGSGKTVWWVGYTRVSPVGASLSEGADPTAASANARRVSGTLTEYGKLIKNSRLFMDTAIDGIREEMMKDLARDAARTLDDAVLTTALAGSNVVYGGTATSRATVVKASTATVKVIRKATRLLQLSSVPTFPDGFYAGLVHPDVAFDIQTDSAWQDIVRYRDTVKYDIQGEIGRIYGVRFASAPTIPVLINSGSATAHDVYRTLVFGPGFVGQSDMGELEVIMNEPGRASELRQFNTYGYRFVVATGLLHNARGIRVETSATLATTP